MIYFRIIIIMFLLIRKTITNSTCYSFLVPDSCSTRFLCDNPDTINKILKCRQNESILPVWAGTSTGWEGSSIGLVVEDTVAGRQDTGRQQVAGVEVVAGVAGVEVVTGENIEVAGRQDTVVAAGCWGGGCCWGGWG